MAKKRYRTKSLEAAITLVINNTDLLFEIFLRLPAKSLIRFKLVSKSWLSLISDTQFCITHTRQNIIKSSVSSCYYQGYCEKVIISLHGRSSFPAMTCLDSFRKNPKNDPEIVHSCNGLILLRQGDFNHSFYQEVLRWNFILFNPTTQKYRLLVIPSDCLPNERSWIYPENTFLAFEPLKSHHYKVVILCSPFYINHIRVIIYSSQNESWKRISITASLDHCYTNKIYWNGAIHWLNGDNCHLQLDVDAEKLIKKPLPPKPRILGGANNQYFGESKGRLFFIQRRRAGAPGFRMLELDMKTHSWSTKHQINLRPLAKQYPLMHQNTGLKKFKYYVLYVESGDDMKSFSLVLAIPGTKIVTYEVIKGKSHTNTTNVLCDFPHLCLTSLGVYTSVHPLVQCLAPF